MDKEVWSELLYLNSVNTWPSYLQGLVGFKTRHVRTLQELRTHVGRVDQKALVVIEMSHATRIHIETFLRLLPRYSNSHFIFISQVIDNSVFALSSSDSRFMVLHRDEVLRFPKLAELWKAGEAPRSRRQPRYEMRASVMVKKSKLNVKSPTGTGIHALTEGQLCDFSEGGAKLQLRESCLEIKDFIVLMYKSQRGKWVSVEAQLRWVKSLQDGQQLVGVQFLAMSA